ncbi:hypothetical protein Q8F55_007918 [Vanrija albida]|uniref:HTH La-type RNA-binding domain-containing protein n=1 Tax=Vanrija albida TaxID=181172 RepID=A0ABR3PUW5_9TREE
MTQSGQSKSTSVFQALGSYADRIKDQPNGASKASSSSTTPTPAAANSSKKANSRTMTARPASPAPAQSKADADAEDGPWETVRTGRNRTKPERQQPQDEKRASNSRNWRERDDKAADSKDKAAEVDRPQKDEPAPKKDEAAASASSSKGGQAATRPAVTPPKSAWAATGGKGAAAASAAVAAAAPAPPAPVESAPTAAATNAKPIANGTPAAGSATATTASSSSATPAEPSTSASASSKADEEGNWRARPKSETTAAPAPTPAPAPSVPRQAAPPPATNAWDLRRKVQPATPAPTAAAPASSNVAAAPLPQPSQAASSSAGATTEANGDAKAGSSKKAKKKAEPAAAADASLWPDVSQAAEAVKVAEGNKGKHEKKGSEVSVEEAPSSAAPGGKKQKWKAIPAAELQEAADKVAETHRKAKAKAQKAKADADEGKNAKGKKGGAEHAPAKSQVRLTRSSSQGADSRRPPFGHLGASELRLGGAGPDVVAPSVIGSDKGVNGLASVNGNASTPMSRTGSQQSKRGSPSQVSVPLSPGGVEDRAARSSSTGTLPQTGFPSNSSASLPRPPRQTREREGRGGAYGGGRGRAGYRSVPATPRLYGELSPLQGNMELANLYRQGYAVPYGYFPVPAQYLVSGSFDAAAQGNYAGVPASFPRSAPPPAPVTQVPGLDPLRVYVLGQIEYYFSVQNLAMDFFLRQQMDSEGWIDTAMIASFNRIKQMVTDVALVTEVMTMSSLLEVKDDKVRLTGGEAKRWVLPDAKPSKFGTNASHNPSPKKSAGEGAAEVSHGIPASMDASALGLEDLDLLMPTSPQPKFDVENALMKSSASTNMSSAASALASDDAKTLTPTTTATSIAEEVDDVFEDKPKMGHE